MKLAKKLELLSKLGEVKISKSGNYYVILSSETIKNNRTHGCRSIRKSEVSKIGESYSYDKKIEKIILLTTDGKIFIKDYDSKLQKLSHRHCASNEEFLELFLYGRKSEFLKNYDKKFMNYFNFLKSFSSFKEVFKYLGCTFKVEATPENLEKILIGYKFKNKQNLVKCELSILQDTINLLALNDQLNLNIYNTNKSINTIHLFLINENNKKEAMNFSSEKIKIKGYEKIKKNLHYYFSEIKILESPRELFLAGREFNNCIAGRSYLLDSHLFVSFSYEEVKYIAQLSKDGIFEIKKRYNGICEVKDEIEYLIYDFKK